VPSLLITYTAQHTST